MHGLVSICLVTLALFVHGYQCIPAGEQPVSRMNLLFLFEDLILKFDDLIENKTFREVSNVLKSLKIRLKELFKRFFCKKKV